MVKDSGIYAAILEDSIVYVGSSVNMYHRVQVHVSLLRHNKHHSPYFQHGWNKHGEKAFSFIVLELTPKDQLFMREQFYIDLYQPKYNVNPVAGSRFGSKQTEAAKQKISLGNKGKVVSNETKRRQSEAASKRFYKTYTLLSPEGVVTEITNMREFCRQHGYSDGAMQHVINGRRKSAYGWRKT
jgi:hypothetical protein